MEEFIIPQKVTICLNMIVKNESHIIEKTLEKLCNKIKFDYWVICDTGSTDNTPEIITEFFSKKDIKGEIHYDAWENFAHNRTLALKRAYKKTDLLLVFDADDEIVGDIKIPTDVLFDEYSLKFGSSSGTSYTRVLMINNHKIFEYLSVIHEFITCKEGPTKGTRIEGDYYVVSGRTGSRSFDKDKYLKDALILEKAHADAVTKKDPLFHRYAFYCANSYKDCGKFEDAVKWYKITLNQEHQWYQEKYIACLCIYECFEKLKQMETGFFYLVKAFAYDNERLECLYPLLVHYCCENMHKVAYNYYLNIKDFFENKYLNTDISTKLFVTPDKYNFFVPYYMIIIADKVKDFECVVKMYEIIFTKKQRMFEEWYIKNLLFNLQYFLTHVTKDNTRFIPLANEYFKFVFENGIELQKFDFLSKPEYKNAGIITDNYIIKEVTNKSQHFSKNECANSKNILIYTGFSDIDWNYTYMQNNALGGSEKAVAYLSKCFPKDYNIFISGHVKNEIIDNIQYIHLNELTNLIEGTPFHTLIVSRYIGFYEMFKTCSFYQSFIWAHDISLLSYGCNLNETRILKKWNNYIDGCVCLTEWHKTIFSEKYPELKNKITLINNGLELTSFPNVDSDNILKNNKIKNKFIYSSRPDRGLNILLKLWPLILEKIPDATLTISTYGSFPSNAEEDAMKTLIDSTPSIHYLGKLNVEQLYNEMSSAEFWLYPTHWSETSCITALEMLMSEVICLYYPVAGLVNTVGDYGIQIKPGSEIDAIVSLTDFKKENLRKNGSKYASSCSWENRAKKWTELLELTIINKFRIPEERITHSKKINKLGIFNGFPFHYEMFGFILNYAQNNNYEVDIFTNKSNTLGWFEFYSEKFNNFNINDISKFNGDTSEYATFFVTTDDDSKFKSEWIRDNVVCVNHYYRIRTSNFKHYLNIANFKDSTLEYVYPCYPLINYRDKIQNSNVCIIGGGNIHNINVINRLQSNGRIKLNVFVRKECKTNISELEVNKFDINFIEDVSTFKMIQILNQSSYVLVNYSHNEYHNNGITCSGSLQLALSTLCKPIIVNSANKYLQIKNALEYDIKSNEPIFIDKEINFQLLEQERNNYVDKFENLMNAYKITNNLNLNKHSLGMDDFTNVINKFNINLNNIFEIGSMNGFDANVLSQKCNVSDIHIFEAVPNYCKNIKKQYPFFTTNNCAVNNYNGTAKFNIIKGNNNYGISSLKNRNKDFINDEEYDTVEINSIRMDKYIEDNNINSIDVCKIDAEGCSYEALEGFGKYLNYIKFLHIKSENIQYWENQKLTKDIFNLLENDFIRLSNSYNVNEKQIDSIFVNKEIIRTIGQSKEINNKNLCLLTYGQLRTFKNNFRNNLLELYPVYKDYENVYIFILLDELSSNEEVVNTVYKENCDYIENICKEFNIKIGFIQDINNLNYKHEEMNYCSKLLLQKSDDKKQFPNNFVLNLFYRKYKLIELVEEYCIDHKVDISAILHSRLFDVIIKKNISASTILNNLKNTDLRKTIFYSPDTIFFGNHNLIKKIMKFENIYTSDELWNNKDFCNFSYRFDSILTNNKDTYAPEIQYTANMYFQSIDGINLRYYKPDPNCLDTNLMYEVILDSNRHKSTSYKSNNKLFNLNLTREFIVELNNSIDSNYLEYFNESGLNDYKQKIGSEHYKLLCAISSQICNGIIVDIGTHNGNSAVALGYNLYKNKNNILDRSMLYTFDITDLTSESCRKFINNYCIHSSLENIFDYTIRDKYKNVLLESELIMIDIDPHNGVLEYELYSWLFENNYKGIILFDDIFLEKGHTANNYQATYQSMKIFWNKIPDKYKLDITHIGHWSGTGLVSFNTNNIIKLDSNKIPKKIFQTWETRDIEQEFQQIINKWKENNPNYEYIFHDAEQRLQFIQDNFEENVLNAYKKIIPGAYQCDLWRYCVLYIYGGFYADIDTLCLGQLNRLTNENIEFIVPIDLNINPTEGQHNLACGFIGSVPKSPILLDAIDRIVFNVENNIIPTSKLDFSGPGLLGRAVNKFLNLDETSSFKGKEGIQNNINFLEFDPNTEYMKDVYTDTIILQNKNKNSDIIRLYNNECNKIINYTCWLSNNVIKMV